MGEPGDEPAPPAVAADSVDGRIVSVAVTIAVGANTAGRREVLGMAIGPSEAETFWTDFLPPRKPIPPPTLNGAKSPINCAPGRASWPT